ncbi:hypothetical protein L0F63_001304 [Massospora cicadina]|nr:hypothetical protein L0F63_001304 [Massospora cicadina]
MATSMMKIILGLNGISAICGLSVVLMVLMFAFRRTGISLIDFLKHVLIFFSRHGDETFGCSMFGFFTAVLAHMYLMFNLAITLNLQLVIMMGYTPNPKWELYYWLIPFLIAGAVDLPIFGLTSSGTCFIKNGTRLNDSLEILYFNLKRNKCVLKEMLHILEPRVAAERADTIKNIRKLILRSTLYPLACFLCHVGIQTHILYQYITGRADPALRIWGFLGLISAGILNLITFLSDPLVQKNLYLLSPFTKASPCFPNQCLHIFDYKADPSPEHGLEREESDQVHAFIRYT